MAKRKKRKAFAGSPDKHRRDAEIFLRNTRRAAADFQQALKSGNCAHAYRLLITATMRGAEYKLSKEFGTSKRRGTTAARGSTGSIHRLIGMERRFERKCVRRPGNTEK